MPTPLADFPVADRTCRLPTLPLLLLLIACNRPPLPPGIALTPAGPGTLSDLVVEIVFDPADPDGDGVSYSYTWLQDGVERTDLTASTVPASETTKGEAWTVRVTPTDGTEPGAPAEAVVVILDSPPILTVAISPADPLASDPLVAVTTATDDDGDEVRLTYVWTREGAATPYGGDTVPGETGVHGETWEVTVSPIGPGEPVTDAVIVQNTAPTAEAVTLSPTPAGEESLVVATASGVQDADGDPVTVGYDWYVDGALVQSGEDDTLTGDLFSKHQLVHVEATPNDGFEDGEPVTSEDLLIDNTAPTGGSLGIDPAVAYETTTANCVAAGFEDVDGDAEAWRYSWEVDGVVVASTATLDGSLFSRDDALTCIGTPTDGELDGTAIRSEPIVVLNTAPTLGSVSLSTTSPSESDTVTAILGAATDDDGDSISYAYSWYVNGSEVSTASGLTPDLFGKGSAIYVIVTPNDGTDSGATVTSDTATSVNSPPTGTSVSISPSAAYTNDTLTASPSVSDADGDAIVYAYAWYVDSALVGTSSTLSGTTDFNKGQSVYVVVTPNDGEADGPAASSATVTILDSAPSAPGVSISPSNPEAGDDLICSVTTASSDADGDAIDAYTYAWARDGVAYTGATTTSATGDTVDGVEIVDTETWTCSVTATAAGLVSAAGTASEIAPTPVDNEGSYCGDMACDSDESCWSCDVDCGSCDCETDAEVILYTPSAWTVLADALEADPSYCADYWLTLPANSTDKTTPRAGDEPAGIRARGDHFHAVAEFHWSTWSGESGSWYDKGVAFRDLMDAAGYNVEGGDTWAINELPSTVRSDDSVRADALEAIRGLYEGSSGATPAEGIVYVVGMGQDTTNFAVYKPYVQDWLQDASFWSTANLYVRFWAQEVYADPHYACVPGATVADVSSSLNSYVQHFAQHAEVGASDVDTAQSYLGRAYVPLMNAVWQSESGYGDTMVDLDTMKKFVSHQVYAARSWSNDHNYPDGRIGFAWVREDGVDDTDLAELAERLASAIHYAYDEGGGSAAGACSPSGAYTWCSCEVTGAAFNTGWETFESW